MKTLSGIMAICLLASACSTTPQKKELTIEPITQDDAKALIEVIKACDKTVNSCQKAIENRDDKIANLNEELTDRMKRVSDLEKGNVMENKTIWFALGAIFTAIVAFLVRR